MNWKVRDYLQWEHTVEYIDTVLIPFIPLGWENKELVNESEYLSLLLQEVEKSLKGRILVSIPFTYMINEDIDVVWKRFKLLEESLLAKGFSSIIPISCDGKWQQFINEMIIIRAMPIYDMEQHLVEGLVKFEGDLVYKQIISKWK